MDIYKQRSIWNLILMILGIIILVVTVVYANFLADQLYETQNINKEAYIEALEILATNENLDIDIRTELNIVENFGFPTIMNTDGYFEGSNWGAAKDSNQIFLANKVKTLLSEGYEPLVVEGAAGGAEIFFFDSPILRFIRFFPWLQFLMVSIFVAFGYYLFNSSRKSEQSRVWAGMAKETAHQLGTPISAILAWIEYLKESNQDRPDQLEVIGELRNDVNRLELIADRFSKIGSEPELKGANIYDQLIDIEAYMKRRASRKVVFDFPESGDQEVKINKHLFTWVLENLIRNSLDALDGQGTISAKVYTDSHWVSVDVTDTGKGIPSSKFKEIFMPGVSTKKRGWGLGLSLAKRIIEEYHNGKIFVKSSKPNEATTFTIQLPKG